jgi:HTH-type transcriptional regulator/antitoxin HigA
MKIQPIRTDADHEAALTRVDSLMDALLGTPQADELDVLATLKDLEPLPGSRRRVSEVLNDRRAHSLQVIRRINREVGIPIESLVGRD